MERYPACLWEPRRGARCRSTPPPKRSASHPTPGAAPARESCRSYRPHFFLDFLDRWRLRLHDDPSHAEALGFHHLDAQIAELHAIARHHLPPEARRDVAADSLLGRLADVDLQPIRQVLDQVVAAH